MSFGATPFHKVKGQNPRFSAGKTFMIGKRDPSAALRSCISQGILRMTFKRGRLIVFKLNQITGQFRILLSAIKMGSVFETPQAQ